MLHFRTRREAEEATIPRAIREVILASIDTFETALAKLESQWNPDDDGWFSLLEPAEADLPLKAMGWERRLGDLVVEAVHFHPRARLWECVHIPGNNWCWTCFLPDSPALPREVRGWLLAHATEADAALARRARP